LGLITVLQPATRAGRGVRYGLDGRPGEKVFRKGITALFLFYRKTFAFAKKAQSFAFAGEAQQKSFTAIKCFLAG
jgi:hypothetical protein